MPFCFNIKENSMQKNLSAEKRLQKKSIGKNGVDDKKIEKADLFSQYYLFCTPYNS